MVLPKPDETNLQIALQGDAIDKKDKLYIHLLEGEHDFKALSPTVQRWEPTNEGKALVRQLLTLYFSGVKYKSLVLNVTTSNENSLQKIPYDAQLRAYSIKLKKDEQLICYHLNDVELSNGYWLVVFDEKAVSS